MNTPSSAGGVSHGNGSTGAPTIGSTPICCLLGVVMAAGVGIFILPGLLLLPQSLEMLSTTLIITTLLFVWLASWLLLESLWVALSDRPG